MARNYVKEAAWEKEKYRRLSIRLTKEEYNELAYVLEATGETIAAWARRQIASSASQIKENQKGTQYENRESQGNL